LEFLNSARYKVEKGDRQSLVLLAVSSLRSFILLQKLFSLYHQAILGYGNVCKRSPYCYETQKQLRIYDRK